MERGRHGFNFTFSKKSPTERFTISKHQNPWINVFDLRKNLPIVRSPCPTIAKFSVRRALERDLVVTFSFSLPSLFFEDIVSNYFKDLALTVGKKIECSDFFSLN